MWPDGFCPNAGGKRLQSTSRPATMASSAGRSEPMDAEGKGLAIKACFEFQGRAPASFRKDKNRHWVSWTVVPQDLSKLLAGGVDLELEFERATKTLESIGLSGYEARGYIALVAHGYGSAETIAETAHNPRTSADKVLQSLCQKGFAISTRGRPTIFKPEAPSKVKGRVIDHLEDTFAKLDLLHEVLRSKGEPQLVYTIVTKTRVLEKIGELIDQSSQTCIISTPTFSEIRENVGKKIEQAIARGIRFTIITEPGQKIPEGAGVVNRKGLIATDVIVAGSAGLVAAPDLSACGYTGHASLSRRLQNCLELSMNLKE